ncbi:MAG: low molecular weight phosphotyrosine protein phosphatase [Planctomycetota bacterium]|nr:MAG: low molecular weight phosphotyrosine protein phosphatase [Planctomycetota bacterium]
MNDLRRVCFVCLGNICRSPTAEAVFRHLVEQRGDAKEWLIDSCGTGDWHVGSPPDARALRALKDRGYACAHRGRQLCDADFTRFAWLLVMDNANLSTVEQRAPQQPHARIHKLTEWDPQGTSEVGDPYYGGESGFTTVLEQIERCCTAFLAREFP